MNIVQYIGAIALVFSLLALCLMGLQRLGVANWKLGGVRRREDKALEVVERIALTPHHSLHLVRCQSATLLIGVSPHGCNLLTNVGGAAAPPEVRP